MTNSSEELSVDPKEVQQIKEAQTSNEIPLPSNFPRYLFSGTSLANSQKIEKQGFAKGTFTANPIFAIADRFYRGSFIVAQYNAETFKPSDLAFTDFTIKHGDRAKTEQVEFDNVGTGMLSQTGVVKRLPVTKLENVSSVELTREQRDFIGSIFLLFGTGTMDFYSKPTPAEDGVFKNLGIDFSKISNRLELQEVINAKWQTETQFAEELAPHFPGEMKVQWQNGNIDTQDVLREIINQIYLIQIVKNVRELSDSEQDAQITNVINYFPQGAGADYIRSITELSLDDFCNLHARQPESKTVDLSHDANNQPEEDSLPNTILDPNQLDF